MKISINADIGESFGRFTSGNDNDLMPLVNSANIACGMHAGDPQIMVRTVDLALSHGVSIGAHPGFNDLWGFGRRQIKSDPTEIEHLVTYQIGALQALARARGAVVTHVKPHGALNNMAHDDIDLARAIGRAIKAADPDLIFVANALSAMSRAGEELGLRVANEAYVDRRYDANGRMISRTEANAVIRNPEEAASHVLRMVEDQAIYPVDGARLPATIHTLCVHGDEPTAVPVIERVRAALARAGVDLAPIPEMLA